MKLYDTMSRSIKELRPIHEPQVALYTCGPTVYDYAQIGNWATYIRWDTLVRTIRLAGYEPRWVMNITDVGHLVSDADEGEDKLEKGARREGKTAWQVAEFYTEDFLEGMRQLNMRQPDVLSKATEHIAEQIELVKRLEAKGFTYIIDDGVYFDTAKLPDYGKLARLKPEDLKAGARVEFNPQKRQVTDFAVWKFSPKDEQRDMEWDSPWGKGFPGWHLECSAMAMKYLGDTLDIHAGGIDFIPVHHTNEIAQSEGATGKPFANIWLHGNFITVGGVRLGKSLGNSYTLHDIVERGFSPLDLRMLFLQSHYRVQADFTWEALDAARTRRRELQAMADLRWQVRPDNGGSTIDVQDSGAAKQAIDFEGARQAIIEALINDLHTPQALAILSTIEAQVAERGVISGRAPSSRGQNGADNTANVEIVEEFEEFLYFLDEAFGLGLQQSQDITGEQKLLIAEREEARASKDWARSDSLRDQLAGQGIGLRDTPRGAIWQRL